MGTNVCLIALMLVALVAVVYCNDRPKRGCDRRCLLRTLTSGAGKRKKSVDMDQEGYLWNKMDASPTYTADVMTKGPRATCIDEVLEKLSPKWQERLLSVFEAAILDENSEPSDNTFSQ